MSKPRRHIALTTLVVRDYDEAIAWYTDALGFVLIDDDDRGGGKRWVVVVPAIDADGGLLLAQAINDEQRASIGRQAGGRVGFFLHTDDFRRDHTRMLERGVTFRETPRNEAYGTVAAFEDLYGNLWDLLEPTA